ncbi:MAG: hypothetical protein ACI85I_002028 [Arenicella sp.]
MPYYFYIVGVSYIVSDNETSKVNLDYCTKIAWFTDSTIGNVLVGVFSVWGMEKSIIAPIKYLKNDRYQIYFRIIHAHYGLAFTSLSLGFHNRLYRLFGWSYFYMVLQETN